MSIFRSLFTPKSKTQASTEATPLQSPAAPEAKKSFFGHFVSWFQNLKSPVKDSSLTKLFSSLKTGLEVTPKSTPKTYTDVLNECKQSKTFNEKFNSLNDVNKYYLSTTITQFTGLSSPFEEKKQMVLEHLRKMEANPNILSSSINTKYGDIVDALLKGLSPK